jgi:hypothetical protein
MEIISDSEDNGDREEELFEGVPAEFVPPAIQNCCLTLYASSEYVDSIRDPVPPYVEVIRDDPLVGPHISEVGEDSEDELWMGLRVLACNLE